MPAFAVLSRPCVAAFVIALSSCAAACGSQHGERGQPDAQAAPTPPPRVPSAPDGGAAPSAPDAGRAPEPPAVTREPRTSPTAARGAPRARADYTAVWTGREVVIWGGDDAVPREDTGYAPTKAHPRGDGARYDPAADRWAPVSSQGAPDARTLHSAVWSGREMIVFGGHGADGVRLDSGGAYEPEEDHWRALPGRDAPSSRAQHTAVWTGRSMIVWGGRGSRELADGAAYDPETNAWRALATKGAPRARSSHAAVWTGSEMIVWGGRSGGVERQDGGRYDPETDTWRPVTGEGAPDGRGDMVAVWTGSEMIVWGGVRGGRAVARGAAYDPSADRWRPIAHRGAPPLDGVAGAWTGERLVATGEPTSEVAEPAPTLLVYDPAADRWASFHVTPMSGRPLVAAGRWLLSWGGFDGTNLTRDGERIAWPIEPAPAP